MIDQESGTGATVGAIMMTSRGIVRGVVVVYVALVIIAALLAAARLHESAQMPGLAAIELVLLALPWSLALGVEPLARLGLHGMGGVILGGVVLNILVLQKLVGYIANPFGGCRR